MCEIESRVERVLKSKTETEKELERAEGKSREDAVVLENVGRISRVEITSDKR